ncbi:putative membrane protein [Smittium culicis]|uniref:Putative membrane protein n=1 Tax=Smittium culicis TaxID=133412 RepID=A0A1R1X006_9FUNG|nr:putative membrane protein [Smittium culicis]
MSRKGNIKSSASNILPYFAEFIGTFVFVFLSNAITIQQLTIPSGTTFSYFAVCFGHGLALMLGIFIAGGLSGGHLNPVLSLCFATFRKFKWINMLVYWVVQVSAAILAEFLAYTVFFHKLKNITRLNFTGQLISTNNLSNAASTSLAYINGTLFLLNDSNSAQNAFDLLSSSSVSVPGSLRGNPPILSNVLFRNLGAKGTFFNSLLTVSNIKNNYTVISEINNSVNSTSPVSLAAAASKNFDLTGAIGSLFLSELVGTLFLIVGIFAITDIKNSSSRRSAPLNIGMVYFGCKLVFGLSSCGSFFNPAIDISSRLLGLMFFKNYSSGVSALANFSLYPIYLIATLLGPFVGGFLGACFYETLTWSDEEHRIKIGDK